MTGGHWQRVDNIPARFYALHLAWENYLKYLTMRPRYL